MLMNSSLSTVPCRRSSLPVVALVAVSRTLLRCAVFAVAIPMAVLFTSPAAQAASAPLPAPPQLAATSYLLIDHVSGRTLAEKDTDQRIEPASLTKIMTAYVVASELERGSISMEEPVMISDAAQAMQGSRMFAEAGKLVNVEDLLRGLMVQSGNDASVALAEHIAASEPGFADMMNRTAERLGMDNTNYVNASGWPAPDHYTTARDLSILARAMITEYPDIYAIYAEKEFTFNDIKQSNRNSLLWRDETVDGMKTGHTEAAGYCLVASALRDGMRLISIVVGAASDKTRMAESQRLLNYGFRFYRTERIYVAGETISEARIWMGKQPSVPLGVAEDLYVTLPRDAFDDLKSTVQLSEDIEAPARIGQELGRTVLKAEDEIVGEVPLLALRKVEEGGMFLRMKDSIMRYFD